MIPRPTLEDSIRILGQRDEYLVIIDAIRDLREQLFGELGPAENPHEVMKLAGGIARLDELLQLITPK